MTDLAALLLFLFPLAYSPGPGNLFFAGIGAQSGLCASIPASAGYHLATFVVTLTVGYGFVELLMRVPLVFAVINWAGAAYMLWLAIAFLRADPMTAASLTPVAGFGTGAVLLVLNPKAYMIIGLMFTQFLDPPTNGFLPRLLAITTVFTLNNLVAFTVWTLLGEALALLFRGPRAARVLNIGFGVMLAIVAFWMILR